MRYGLGIDTGGTFTDAVLYDLDNEIVKASAKARTTKQDLRVGIEEALDGLGPERLSQASVVSLSTTLATNAAVEGKIGRGTLILIGCDPEVVAAKASQYGLPANHEILFINGGHTQSGEVISVPDWDRLRSAVRERADGTDGFAVVQLWGMRNPEFEKQAKAVITETVKKPVVCAHEILGDLNFLKRAATVLLNVRLIPIMERFIIAVEHSLAAKGIQAPLAIMRGDGSLMSKEFAQERPLETLLSGPAASVVGGTRLTGRANCIVVDMGGTTSDLAVVSGGRMKLAYGGLKVGQWLTGTKSIRLHTIGLGGDSAVRLDSHGALTLGPDRVAPISWLAAHHSDVLPQIEALGDKTQAEFLYLLRSQDGLGELTQQETQILDVLSRGPQTLRNLARELGLSIFDLRLQRLQQWDVLAESRLTPTDFMHIAGVYEAFSPKAARAAAEIMAGQMGSTLDELVTHVFSLVQEKLYLNILTMLLDEENPGLLQNGGVEVLHELLRLGFRQSGSNGALVRCQYSAAPELVGIGAPVHVFLPAVADKLGTTCLIPEHAAVANAVGTITGSVSVHVEVRIEPVLDGQVVDGYVCFAPDSRQEFNEYAEALAWARQEAGAAAARAAKQRHAMDVQVFVETDERVHREVLLDTAVTAQAVGAYSWFE